MVLVDTSTWIKGLAGLAPVRDELNDLLADEQVAAHELVYGELLIGDNGGRKQFLASYELIERVPTVPHVEVVQFVRDRNLNGRGIGWIGIHLLASAVAARVKFWTMDLPLAALALEFGVGYGGTRQASSTFSQ